MKRFCICSLWSRLNVLTFSPLTGGCSEGLGAFWFFFKNKNDKKKGTITKYTCQKKIEEHSIERVWYSASREPTDTLPGSQPCTQTRSVYHTPHSQGFSFLSRHSRHRLGSPWVGPINAARKRLKLATVTPGATSTLSASSPSLFFCCRWLDAFSSSFTHAAINLQTPPCTALYHTPGSSAAVLQSPVTPNSRRSSAAQSVQSFSSSSGPRFSAFSTSPDMTLSGNLWSPMRSSASPTTTSSCAR